MKRRRPGERGFTLVELLVASALAGAVAGLAVILYLGAWRNFFAALDRGERVSRAAGALASLKSEIRAARGVVSTAPDQLALWADDRNADGFAQADEIVAFRLETAGAGVRLVREKAGDRFVLADDLAAVSWAPDRLPPETRLVALTIRVFADGPTIPSAEALRVP